MQLTPLIRRFDCEKASHPPPPPNRSNLCLKVAKITDGGSSSRGARNIETQAAFRFRAFMHWEVMMRKHSREISPEVRAAISAFLSACQKEARPFATSEALGAVRRVFPDLDISDTDLMDAIISEASLAGFDVDTPDTASAARMRDSLEEWENEGGAIDKPPRSETQGRRGRRRRAKATKDRNELL